jgi:hypothetical protein
MKQDPGANKIPIWKLLRNEPEGPSVFSCNLPGDAGSENKPETSPGSWRYSLPGIAPEP